MLTQSVVIWFNRHFTTFIQIWIFFFDVWALNCRQWVIDTPLHTMPFRTMGQVFGGVMCPLLLLRAGPFLSHELAPVGELAIYVWPRGHAKRLHLHLKGVDWHSDDTSSQKKKKDIKLQLATPALRAKLFDGNNPKREVIYRCLWCFPSQPIKSWMGSNSVMDLAGGHKQCWILAMTEFLAARKKAVTNQW